MEGRDPYFKAFVLEDEMGNTVLAMPGYERCATATLAGGAYTLHVQHSGSLAADPAVLARVDVDAMGLPLLVPGSPPVPVAGFWAIQLDPALDSQHRQGRLRVQLPFRKLDWPPPFIPASAAAPVVADFTSQQMDEYSMIHIPPTRIGQYPSAPDPHPAAIYPGAVGDVVYLWDGFPVSTDPSKGEGFLSMVIDNHDPDNTLAAMAINDLGNYEVSFKDGICFAQDLFSPQSLNVYITDQTSPCSNSKFHVAFRFFPDSRPNRQAKPAS